MTCAHHLSQHPDKFDVTLVDAVNYCGGQAFSVPIDKEKHGASWLNQGVQGGSGVFHHTMTMFARQGYHADPVRLQVRRNVPPKVAAQRPYCCYRSPSARMIPFGPMSFQPNCLPDMPRKSSVSRSCSR